MLNLNRESLLDCQVSAYKLRILIIILYHQDLRTSLHTNPPMLPSHFTTEYQSTSQSKQDNPVVDLKISNKP
ncbi:hypothetical protein AM1_5622 [Acaryochloris marina MBIC11017]|uniref:Uncharacterized protein n=1 Tax=Acaryochloris marina (strain MBIC 11017) TaxID=329726 RepID=B0CF56_ACAM1|nr:hypothetical protein AM1_5622 [Acaryochloris marina MBIC11017]